MSDGNTCSGGNGVAINQVVKPLTHDLHERLQTKNPEASHIELDSIEGSIFPESTDQDKRLQAFTLLLRCDPVTGRRRRFEAVAKEVGVSNDTLLLWSSKGGWRKRISALDQEAASAELAILDEFRRAHRETELAEILQDGRTLRQVVREKLSNSARLTPTEIKSLSAALEVVAKTLSQALGMDEAGATAAEREEIAEAAPSKPSVIVYVGGSGALGQPASPRPIDV